MEDKAIQKPRVMPASVWRGLIQCKGIMISGLLRSAQVLGFNIVRKTDYYSPLPILSELKENRGRWYRPSKLIGIEYDLEEFKATLSRLLSRYYAEFSLLPDYNEVIGMGLGPGYTALDALTLYMVIRDYKPRRYLEIGSGVSTYYCSLAAKKNAQDGHPLRITCIEPYPFKKLYSIPGVEVKTDKVQDVDPSIFRELQENDVLFIDSSHVLKIDGDVPFLYLEVLPALNRGVVIHIHDIPFPYNIPYPPELWMFGPGWPKFWNEAMLLQAFLCFNAQFKIIMSTPLLRHFDEGFLRRNIPSYQSIDQNPNTFSSIWIMRKD